MIIKINISYNNTFVIKIQTHIQHNRKKNWKYCIYCKIRVYINEYLVCSSADLTL